MTDDTGFPTGTTRSSKHPPSCSYCDAALTTDETDAFLTKLRLLCPQVFANREWARSSFKDRSYALLRRLWSGNGCMYIRGCSSTRLLDYSTRSKSNFRYSMMLVLDFYKSGNARPDSILELEAHEYPKHEINKKSMEISTKILKSTYKICKNEAKIKKKSYIFTFRQSHNSI